MRIRSIKPEFWSNEKLSTCSEFSHMFAAALLNYVDDEGYFNAHPRLIQAALFPLRDPSMSIQCALIELSNIGFLRLCTAADGRTYGQIVAFKTHQNICRPNKSKIKNLCNFNDSSMSYLCDNNELSLTEQGTGNREQGTGNTPKAPLEGAGSRVEEISPDDETTDPTPDEGEGEPEAETTPADEPLPEGEGSKTPRKLDPLHERLVLVFQSSIRSGKRDAAEIRAWRRVKGDVDQGSVELIERFYRQPKSAECDQTWRRKTAVTQLLNQWHEQVGLAEAFFEKRPPAAGKPWHKAKPTGENLHPFITPIDEEEFYNTWVPR